MHEASYLEAYKHCRLCPNLCSIDRTRGQVGICGESAHMRIAWAGLHRGEEPPVTGRYGSGTIFFSGCPLHCAYCQNCQISAQVDISTVTTVTVKQLAQLMLDLQQMKAANINIVTGTHFIPSIAEAILLARRTGLNIPIVWNSSGYEEVQALEMIDSLIDLYLIDVKTLDTRVAARFCGTKHYVDSILPVMTWLFKAKPNTYVNDAGELYGILIRHLLFPGTLEATKEVLVWFARYAKQHAWLSLMVQFVPPKKEPSMETIREDEYQILLDLLEALEIDDGFVQELADNIPWIPDFTRDNPFPADFADPLASFLALRKVSADNRAGERLPFEN